MEQTKLVMSWEEYKLLLEALSSMCEYTDYKPLNDLYVKLYMQMNASKVEDIELPF
jgi:hypothetical protein